MIAALVQDLRFALRHLRRSPGFAAAAVLILAFGIGANTAMISALNALVVRRLQIPDPDGLIAITTRDARGVQRYMPLSIVDELTRTGVLHPVCGYNGGVLMAVEANGAPAQALGVMVTGQCFAAFGVAPILGRPIGDEDAPLAGPGRRVAVISHRFWTRMFGADPGVAGKIIKTEGVEMTVIGVLPPGFGGLHVDSGGEIFAPFDTIFPAPANRRPVVSEVLGRLPPRASVPQLTARIESAWPALLEATIPATLPAAEAGDLFGAFPKVERIGTGLSLYRTRYLTPVTLVLALTGLLLVLACVNLGGLLLTRLTARSVEVSVRIALGGSRWRISQQMVVESLLLSLAGAALATPVAYAIIVPLASFIPPGPVERTISFTPDLRVLAVTALIGLGAGVLMSVVPAWMAVRRQASGQLLWDRTIASATSRWARGLLVAQVALSFVLLVGAGLLIRSLYLLQHRDVGVQPAGVLNAKLMQLPNGYRGLDPAAYYPALLDAIRALPGVRSAGMARGFPRVMATISNTPVALVGDPLGEARAFLEGVSPGFFESAGIPLVAGRGPSWSDTASSRQVVVVSQSLARALASDGDVLDRRIRLGNIPGHQDVVIVGIAGNATQGNPRLADPLVFYRPVLQMGRAFSNPNVVVAVDAGADARVSAGLRETLRREGREYVHEIASLDAVLTRASGSERMSATLAGAVAGLALILAVIGIHGTLAYSVSRRSREIGLRVALGAAPGAVATSVVRDGLVLTLVGVLVGMPCALMASRALDALMFGISGSDPATFVGIALVFLLLAIAAAFLPARRAATVDPAVALRAE